MDIAKIATRFLQLDEYLDLLKQIGKAGKADFVKDKILTGSAKYYLQVSIEVCLDVAGHIIASEQILSTRSFGQPYRKTSAPLWAHPALGY